MRHSKSRFIVSLTTIFMMVFTIMPYMGNNQAYADDSELKDLQNAIVENIEDVVYTGSEITPEVKVSYDDAVLTQELDYTLEFSNNTNAGEAQVIITGIGNYTGIVKKSFRIERKNISSLAKVNIKNWDASNYETDKACLEENVEISLDGSKLVLGKDYSVQPVSIEPETNKIIYFVIDFKGNYSGSKGMRCLDTVYMAPIKNQLYTGEEIKPVIKAYWDKYNYLNPNYLLKEGVHYILEYINNKDAGMAVIRLNPVENTYGRAEFTFSIYKDISNAKISMMVKKLEYTGEALTPEPIVEYEDKVLEKDKDYELVYSDNINPGTASVVIKGKGNYTGSVTKRFDITRTIEKNVEIIFENWNLAIDSEDDDIFEKAEAHIKENLKVISDGQTLKYNTDYYISEKGIDVEKGIIAYATIVFKGYYSGSEKIRYIGNFYVTGIADQIYTGEEIIPDIKVYGYENGPELEEGLYHTIEYHNNTDIGTATVKILPTGNNYGSQEFSFRIYKNLLESEVSGIEDTAYTGEPIMPEPVVVYEGEVLEKDKDYELSYINNTDVGTASVKIKGIGAYGGTITKEFAIAKRNIADCADATMVKWELPENESRYNFMVDNLMVSYNGRVLEYMKDYNIISYGFSNVVGLVEIKFIGGFCGQKEIRCITYVNDIKDQTYTGKAIKPQLDVRTNLYGDLCQEGIDYTVEYKNNTKPGKATAIVRGIGDKYGYCEEYFNIKSTTHKVSFNANNGSVTTKNKNVTYGGNYGALPTPKREGYIFNGWYTAKVGGKKVTKNTVYNVQKNSTLYAHWSKVTVYKPYVKSLDNNSSGKLKVTIGKVKKADGYQIVIAKDSKFTKGKKTATVKTANSKTFTKLSKTKYYVKIRSYRVDSAGKKIYSKYSTIKKITIKK